MSLERPTWWQNIKLRAALAKQRTNYNQLMPWPLHENPSGFEITLLCLSYLVKVGSNLPPSPGMLQPLQPLTLITYMIILAKVDS